ncbi:MAG: VTT domain-containing protein [Candidatus Omnitrophica bacterium]|nr:VTT domain-containing protein [Candidatus Omnitrophota bacterium]MDD5430268.1 VTT domain-containing protein [Candidatus Omnitrophota bacterium]
MIKKRISSQARNFLIFLGLIALLVFSGRIFNFDFEKLADFLKGTPVVYSCLIFIFLYIVGTFFVWYLKDILKIVGALLFGAYLSTGLIYISEIINAFIFFNISKVLGRGFVEKRIRGRWKEFYNKIGNLNLGWVFLLRAVPLVPYRVLDLGFGLSRFSFRKYILVVLLASPVRIFWIQFILAAARGASYEKIRLYFLDNKLIFILSFIYFAAAFITALALKKKFKQ